MTSITLCLSLQDLWPGLAPILSCGQPEVLAGLSGVLLCTSAEDSEASLGLTVGSLSYKTFMDLP